MKTIYYYQTFVGLDKLMNHLQDIDVIIVSSIHFDKINGEPQIYLNDNKPDDKIFDQLWLETEKCSAQGVTIMLMIGGAGGAYQNLFNNFEANYIQLRELLREKTWIQGIDLDIEESVKIEDIQKLMDRLIDDFGEDFIITIAPVASTLITDGGGMGGFNYKDLYNSSQGKYIKWFNTQCYDSFSIDTYHSIIKNGYPPDKVVMGMESGQFDEKSFKEALQTIRILQSEYSNMAGVFDWEYLDAPPSKDDPSLWCRLIKNNKIKDD
tara:strand:- start:997 stop:1794 length:798 start_codon:yes stop_codon:yes gene_type:complete